MVDISIRFRGMAQTESLKHYVMTKIGAALDGYERHILSCEVSLVCDRNVRDDADKFRAEVCVRAKGSVVRAECEGHEMHAVIDEAARLIERRMRKYKTRIVDKRRRDAASVGRSAPAARAAAAQSEREALADVADDVLIRRKEVELELMSIDEAMVRIDLLGHDFYLFSDIESGAPCVAYRRHDGGYGVIVGM